MTFVPLTPVAPGRFNVGPKGRANMPRTIPPIRTVRINTDRVSDGRHYQPALIRYRDRLLCAFRSGGFGKGDYVTIAELTEDYEPKGRSVHIRPSHPTAVCAFEDARLFIHDGALYCSGDGLSNIVNGHIHNVTMLYLRLDDALQIEREYRPNYGNVWEKNWAFFSHESKLYAVYSILPHKVLWIDGEHVDREYISNWSPVWQGGYMRGGASPVRVGEEYWHFFHGVLENSTVVDGVRVYTIGAYCFEAKPPFRPTRYIASPIAYPTLHDRHPGMPWYAVYFTCGAVLENGVWKISYGRQEQWAEIAEWRHSDLEKAMVSL